MGVMVIAAYRPRPGHEAELLAMAKTHVPTLRQLGLATDRPTLAMRAKDGTIVEVFEGRDGGVEAAHEHPDVQAMWEKYAAICDYMPLAEVAEARDLFAMFEPVDL